MNFISAIKRWLVAQGFTERVAALVMWQAGLVLVIVIVLTVTLLLKAK